MKDVYLQSLLVIMVLLAGCRASVAECPKISGGHKVGKVEAAVIIEASGIAASRRNAGVLWVHNDGGPACVYALNKEGKLLGTYNLAGARVNNWEDIAIGPGPDANTDYLYVGDTGDNNIRRKKITVYRVAEPNGIDVNQKAVTVNVGGVEAIEMVYPDGPKDAETLIVDPITKDIYVISKENPGRIYRAASPQTTKGKMALEYVGKLPFGTATGGDISRDGRMIIVRNYFDAYIWMRPKDGPMWKAFEGEGCKAKLIIEPQGEAICFDANGAGYYTTSEHKHQAIYYFGIEKK